MKFKLKDLLVLVLIFLPLIITLIALNYLPDLIPAHYGFNGQVDRWGSKYEALILPIIALVSGGILFVCTKIVMKDSKNEKNKDGYYLTNYLLTGTMNILTISFLIGSFNQTTDLSRAFSFRFIYIALGVGTICLGRYFPKLKQNNAMGIRIGATLRNEEVWNKTHKVGGKIFALFGVAFVLISCIISTNYLMWIYIIGIITFTVWISIYANKIEKNL